MIEAAAIAGLAGSVHCAAMCGPLAMAARGGAGYHAGRLAGYAAAGALMGTLGQHALCMLPVDTVQTAAVVLVAGMMAWRGLSLLLRRPPAVASVAATPVPLGRRRPSLAERWARLAARLPRRGLWLGLATAVLPCGMLVGAWVLATGSGSPAAGAFTMVVFALASAPGLILPVVGRRLFARAALRLPRSAEGLAWCALAVWIAVRPLLGAVHQH